jgi:transcriptional regulator
MTRQCISVNRGPGMTFAEIAYVLGETRSSVCMTYIRAMRKLKARPEALKTLQSLATELDRERNRHQIVEM